MTSALAGLVAAAGEAFPAQRARELVLALAALDRAQGSAGLAEACLVVMRRFPEAELEAFLLPRDGARTWWSFRAPRGWTPKSAWLAVPGGEPAASYAMMPCILATGSAGMQRAIRPIVLADAVNPRSSVAGAMLVARSRAEFGAAIANAAESGIAAIITDAFAIVDPTTGAQGAGRIELPADSTIPVFSLTRMQLDQLLGSGNALVEAEAIIEQEAEPAAGALATQLDTSVNVLLTAHLCHRAPGANDNSSGVAAVLGAAAALRTLSSQPVGLLCGSEMVAAAWWAHEAISRTQQPAYVLNADTVAGSRLRCGASLELEVGLGPELPLAAIVMAAAHRLASNSPCDLTTRPFVGASDHGVFASAAWRPNVVSLTSTLDRFNHTSLDRAETLDWTRLRHAGVLLAASAAFLAELGGRYALEMLLLVEQWLSARLSTAAPSAASTNQIEGWAEHLEVLTDSMRCGLVGSARADFASCLARLRLGLERAARGARQPRNPGTIRSNDRWRRCVEGPFNLFGLMERLDTSSASALLTTVRADKSRLALLIALHSVLEVEVGHDALAGTCGCWLDRSISGDELAEALGWLQQAGWASRICL